MIDPKTLPRQRDVEQFYGKPGLAIESQLMFVDLKYPLRLDWSLGQSVRRLRLHKKCAETAATALAEVFDHYGQAKARELGLDRYAGGYNHRKMRGGNSWSMHAYGCAMDFHAGPNGLKVKCPDALFCGPDYKDFLDIMERNGWLPAIRLWGADAMHFQAARL
jgi:hypothetical protein